MCTWSIILGLLAFAGDSAINAVFSLSVTALYVAYSLPICARFLGTNDFEPGPFNLCRFSAPVAIIAVLWMLFTSVVFMFPTTPETTVEGMNYAFSVSPDRAQKPEVLCICGEMYTYIQQLYIKHMSRAVQEPPRVCCRRNMPQVGRPS